MKRPLFVGLAVLLLMLLYPSQSQDAFACQCNPELPLTRLEKSDAVFSGKVMDLAYVGQKGYLTIEVDTIWKGISDGSVTILDNSIGGCPIGFRVGADYLVYANKTSGIFGEPILGVYACQGTRNLSYDSLFGEPEVFGAGYLPTTEEGTFARSNFYLTSFLANPLAVLGVVATAAIVGFIILRRRKPRPTGAK